MRYQEWKVCLNPISDIVRDFIFFIVRRLKIFHNLWKNCTPKIFHNLWKNYAVSLGDIID